MNNSKFKEERLIQLLEKANDYLRASYKEALRIKQPSTILVALENIAKYILTLIEGFKEVMLEINCA
jgi:hypothetical protein